MTATSDTASSPAIRSLIPARIDRLPWSGSTPGWRPLSASPESSTVPSMLELTRGEVEEAQQGKDDQRLARAARSCQRDRSAGGELQVQAAENGAWAVRVGRDGSPQGDGDGPRPLGTGSQRVRAAGLVCGLVDHGLGSEPRSARRVRDARLTGRRPTALGRPWNRPATPRARKTRTPSSTGPVRPACSAAEAAQATPARPTPPASAHAVRPSPTAAATALVRAPTIRSRSAS